MSTITCTASNSDWVLSTPARHRRSLPPAAMSKFPKRKSNTCAALYGGGIGCSKPVPSMGIRWCSLHNEERKKLYANYKADETRLRGFPDIPPCHDVATIRACESLSLLREWNVHLRRKYNLLTRCIEARLYFTQRFFGEDMDFGHKTHWDGLVQKRSEVEQLLTRIAAHGYQLILKDQNALWILEKDTHETGDCSGYKDLPRDVETSLHSTDSVEAEDPEDPLEAILRERAIEFKEKIRMCLAWYGTPLTSRFHDERLEVIYAYVRRAIYMDPSLMFLSHNYHSVMALLSDDDLDLATLKKLWHVISALCIHDVQSAVDDVVRSTDGDHVVVLGGKVFKEVSGERWPLHAWGHMMAMRRCYSCLRRTCRTIDEVIDLNRYAMFTRVPLSQTHLKYNFSIDGCRELILAGFIPIDVPRISSFHTITWCGSSWEEVICNLPLFAGLSLTDPQAQAFVNACIRFPGFMVMLRKGANARVIRSSSMWTCRKRQSQSCSALGSEPWKDFVCYSDLALDDAQPTGWGQEKITDCMQVIVVDTSEGTMRHFVRKLVKVWCQVYKVDNEDELYDTLKGVYEAKGELEAYQEVTGKIALDCYQSLWGCMPPPALAGDPESFRF